MLVVSSLFFITFMILVILACLTEYLQSRVSKSSKLQAVIGKFKQLLLFAFIGCELAIMPGFIMTAEVFQNLSRMSSPASFQVSSLSVICFSPSPYSQSSSEEAKDSLDGILF